MSNHWVLPVWAPGGGVDSYNYVDIIIIDNITISMAAFRKRC